MRQGTLRQASTLLVDDVRPVEQKAAKALQAAPEHLRESARIAFLHLR